MSTYWGYYCRTCDVASDHWHNHGDDMLTEFYEVWHILRDRRPIWVELHTHSRWADQEMSIFLSDHDGHDVALQSEYGDVKDMADGLTMTTNTCQTCRHWTRNEAPFNRQYGSCGCTRLSAGTVFPGVVVLELDNYVSEEIPATEMTDALISQTAGDDGCSITTGQDFGCIHWTAKT